MGGVAASHVHEGSDWVEEEGKKDALVRGLAGVNISPPRKAC